MNFKLELEKDVRSVKFFESRKGISANKKYEEYAYVLGFRYKQKSITVKGRDGTIITSVGASNFRLLEILGEEDVKFEIGEKIYIGKEGRTKVSSVLGKLKYEQISSSAKQELANIFKKIILETKPSIIKWFTKGKPLTPKQIEKLIDIIFIQELDLSQGIIRKVFRIDW